MNPHWESWIPLKAKKQAIELEREKALSKIPERYNRKREKINRFYNKEMDTLIRIEHKVKFELSLYEST